jgi:hypothetical protein
MQSIISALLAAAGPALQQALPQLLSSPAFQSIIKAALDKILVDIAAGAHPTEATNQNMGKVGAAALLHLTGNPIADFGPLFGLKPPVPAGTTPPATAEKWTS